MLKKATKIIIAMFLCAILVVAGAINVCAMSNDRSDPSPTPSPTSPPESNKRLSYEREIDPADKERPFNSIAVFVNGKECKRDGILPIYPGITYEIRNYFSNDASDETITNVQYAGTMHPGIIDRGYAAFAGGLVVDGNIPETNIIKMRSFDGQEMEMVCDLHPMVYYANGEGIANYRGLSRDYALAAFDLDDENAELYLKTGAIGPGMYGYTATEVVFFRDFSYDWTENPFRDAADEVIKVAAIALLTS